jgi:hypothetical protein
LAFEEADDDDGARAGELKLKLKLLLLLLLAGATDPKAPVEADAGFFPKPPRGAEPYPPAVAMAASLASRATWLASSRWKVANKDCSDKEGQKQKRHKREKGQHK